MLNTITLAGRLTADPELRRTAGGIAVTSFCLACDRDAKNKETGARETDFIDVITWSKTAEFVDSYVKKGEFLVVKGRLQIRNWTDKNGSKRRSAEINAESVYTFPRQAVAESEPYAELTDDDSNLPF